jgi:hypothetical protein
VTTVSEVGKQEGPPAVGHEFGVGAGESRAQAFGIGPLLTVAFSELRKPAKVVTQEQMELSRLRADNVRLKWENDILKKRRRISRKIPYELD